MSIDIRIVEKIDNAIKTKIEDIGNTAERAHAQVEKLKKVLSIKANATVQANNQIALSNARLAAGLDRLASSTTRYAFANNSLIRSLNSVKVSIAGINTNLRNMEHGFNTATSRLRGFLATMVLIGSTGRITQALDTFRSMQQQLSQQASNPQQLGSLTQGLFDIAQEARVPLEGLPKVFRRVDNAYRDMGRSQQEALQSTGTMAKLLTLSGANAQEAASSLLQLSQAFSKGKLDGDEFRTTAELMPEILAEIAKNLGVARGALFEMSKAGDLTSSVLADAFKTMDEKVSKMLDSLPRTIGQAFTQFRNAIEFGLSKTATESGFVDGVVRALDLLRFNLDIVAKAAIAFGAAITTAFGVAAVGYLTSLINPISSVTLAIVGLVGYFAFYSQQIQVAGEKSASLSSVVRILASDIAELLKNRAESLFGEMFSIEGAQKNFDLFASLINTLRISMNNLVASVAGTKAALANLFSVETRYQAIGIFLQNMGILLRVGLPTAISGLKEAWRVAFDAIKDKIKVAFDALKSFANYNLEFIKQIVNVNPLGTNWLVGQIETAQKVLDSITFDGVVNGASKSGPEIGIALEGGLRMALNPIGEIERALRELSKVPGFEKSGFMKGIDKLENVDMSSPLEEFRKVYAETEKSLNEGQKAYFKSLMERATEFDRVSKEARAQAEKDMEQHRKLQGLRPEEFGLPSGFSESVKNAAQSSQQMAQAFGDIHKYASAIQDGLKSINKSGIQDYLKYENQLRGREITNTVGTNPEAYRNSGFTEKFINDQVKAVQAQREFNIAAQQTPTILNTVGQAQTQLNTVQQQAPPQFNDPSVIQQAGQAAQQAGQQIGTAIQSGVQTAQQAISTLDGSGFQGITQAAQQAGQSIGQSISQGAQRAGQGIQQMAAQATASLGQVRQAAEQAAAAIARLNAVQQSGSGLSGFSTGGYTGNVGVNTPAGIVHGQEYVMPAGPTRKYRDLLEAMRSGRLSTGTMPTGGTARIGGGSNVNVTVENYGSSKIEVQQLSATEIRIIAREEAVKSVAKAINNPNSRVSKSLAANTTSNRRR